MQTKLHRGGGAKGFGCRAHRKRGQAEGWSVFLFSFVAIACCLCAGCKESKPQVELAQVLTGQTWGRELGGGALQERYIFHFLTNGTYRVCVQNAFGMRAVNGTWHLSRTNNGTVILHLENPEGDYHCIWRESKIRYDKQRDVLLVSGGQIGGEQELRHIALTNKAPVQPPPKGHGWHPTERAVRGCKPTFRAHRH